MPDHAPTPLMAGLGKQMREARVEARLTRLDVALRVGVGQRQIERWEQGRSTLAFPRLVAWASALGLAVTVDPETPPTVSAIEDFTNMSVDVSAQIKELQACLIQVARAARTTVQRTARHTPPDKRGEVDEIIKDLSETLLTLETALEDDL